MKKLVLVIMTLFCSFVSASDFTCYGVGFADHLENQIEIKRSFWSGSIINILFRKHTN